MNKVIVIGAGSIGKGVMVPLFMKHKDTVTLANRSIEKIANPLIDGYYVHEMKKSTFISGYLSCGLDEDVLYEKIKHANVIVVTTSDDAISWVYGLITRMIEMLYQENQDIKRSMLLVSNAPYALDYMKESVLRVIPKKWFISHMEILHVLVFIGAKQHINSSYDIDVNAIYGAIEMEQSQVTNLNSWQEITTIKNATHRLEIKLALVNRVQLYFALLGEQKNYIRLSECFQDLEIYERAKASYEEACAAMYHQYPDEIDQDFMDRLWNRVLMGEGERLDRFLRNIHLKLDSKERIKIPLIIAVEAKLPHSNMMDGLLLAQAYCKKREEV